MEMAAEGRWHCTSGEAAINEVFRAGHYRNMTDTGNRARKTSGTQGKEDPASVPELEVLQKCVLMNLRLRRGSDILTLPRQPE